MKIRYHKSMVHDIEDYTKQRRKMLREQELRHIEEEKQHKEVVSLIT